MGTMITMVDSEYLQDKKVQKIDSDIRNFKTDLQNAEMELKGLDSRLDAEIGRLQAEASSRRDAIEAVRKRLRNAEREFKDADNAFRAAQQQKEKTRSTLKKKVNHLRKRIRDAERTKEKRFRELTNSMGGLRSERIFHNSTTWICLVLHCLGTWVAARENVPHNAADNTRSRITIVVHACRSRCRTS